MCTYCPNKTNMLTLCLNILYLDVYFMFVLCGVKYEFTLVDTVHFEKCIRQMISVGTLQ